MADYKLSKFGVRVPEEPTAADESENGSAPESGTTSTPRYRNGRCPAVLVDEGRRCRSPTSRMRKARPFCGTHGRQRPPVTIDSGPEELILLMGDLGDVATLGALDPEEVDFDLERIREAVSTVKRGEA